MSSIRYNVKAKGEISVLNNIRRVQAIFFVQLSCISA